MGPVTTRRRASPDLAPTAPQSTRNLFSILVPSLDQPVSQACKNRINSPNRTFLGKPQLNRFLNAVKSSTATWKVVMNETPDAAVLCACPTTAGRATRTSGSSC